ncbi:MAG: ABC transporter permease [Acidobacteriota bacterium]
MWHSLRRLLQHRVLIQTLVVRELKARYRNSALGFLWSFVNPLLLLAVYTFVFTVIFIPPGREGVDPYALFMFCGLLPWTWFSGTLSEAANSLVMHGNLIKKLVFPAEVLPVVSVFSNGIHFLLGLPIYLVFWVILKPDGISWHFLWLPLVILVQFVFSAGLSLLVAALTVHYRDVRDLLANLLTLWFFASPIIYSFDMLPDTIFLDLLQLNPMTHIVIGYQDAMFTGQLIHWKRLGVTGLLSVGLFFLCYMFFDRLRDSFAEGV